MPHCIATEVEESPSKDVFERQNARSLEKARYSKTRCRMVTL